jgi:hypothetical protein
VTRFKAQPENSVVTINKLMIFFMLKLFFDGLNYQKKTIFLSII